MEELANQTVQDVQVVLGLVVTHVQDVLDLVVALVLVVQELVVIHAQEVTHYNRKEIEIC